MGRERLRQILLAALLVVLAFLIFRLWPRPAASAPAASNTTGAARKPGGGEVTAPDVKLEALQAERPTPDAGANRNLFRFGRPPAPERPPEPPPGPAAERPPRPPTPAVPTVPPIPLRLIGFRDVPGRGKMAILSDTTGRDPLSGFEGDVILGQYRIVRVGPDSVDIAYLDGRGRQTIRLSGS